MTKKRMKIFVSAYACEPNLGSEIGVGWHWVLEMSKCFELWVLTRQSNRKNIEPWIAEHPDYAGIHWLYYDLPEWARWWKRGLRGVHIYYIMWQWLSNGLVERTMKEQGIGLFHHLTYGNAMWPVSRFGQRQQFVWGPIGGLETIPSEFARYYGAKDRLWAWVRRMNVRLLPCNPLFAARCRKASLIFCKTEATRSCIPQVYQHKVRLMTDVACDAAPPVTVEPRGDDIVRFISVGRLDAWRGFDLVLEAFGRVAREMDNVELLLVGKGPDWNRLERIMGAMEARDKVRMMGQVSHKDYHKVLAQCHVVVNAALKEGAVTVAFDAITHEKPLVCIDSGGYTRLLHEGMCECVAPTTREGVIEGLAQGMKRYCDPEQRRGAAEVERTLLAHLNWTEKGKEIRDAILETDE